MKKTHTIFTLVFSILATVAVICILVFLLKVIQNKNEHASAVLVTLAEKTKEKENAVSFAEQVTEIKELQDSIISHFVNPNKIDTFVSYLEEIGPKIGSEVTVENIEMPKVANNTIIFDLTVEGTFREVMQTINFLENIPYRVNITQVYLNKNSKEVVGGKNKTSTISNWRADVSFSIVSL